jgi:putative ABC transport system permease protein
MEDAWRDLLFAVRSLTSTPGFTAIAVLVIAVGISVNTAVFSVIKRRCLVRLPGILAARASLFSLILLKDLALS